LPYRANGVDHIARLLRPADGRTRALVVLLPDWRGQTGLARDHAAFLTERGCAVALADLYGGGHIPESAAEVGPRVGHLLAHRPEGAEALRALVAALGQTDLAGLPVICLGYSAGGMIALDYGRSNPDVVGIILCSALLKTAEAGMDTHIPVPVLILQGSEDQVSPMSVIDAVVAEMDAAGNDARIVLFSQTHHAFDNPEAGTDPTARLCYSPLSAARARQAIAAFVDEIARS
jgi:dienelactone hydrolase